MADIAIFRINYKSDFILTLNSDAGWTTPFCIKFWTGAPSQAYYAYYDGTTYTHCTPVDGEPTKLLVQFDDHHLPIGDLKFQIGYHFTVDDFPTSVEDEVLNQASVIIEVDDAPAQVMLDLNGETAPEIEFSLPAYANEAQRIANEEQRIAAEAIRIVNEESRIAAETIRQQNEAQRISNEESRVAEFAQMKQESETATADANAAATLANEKAALAADKAALADDAATLANDKAQLAADKAALADDAATLANDKAALAQQKAAYAQEQGDYAKAQGDYAKAQSETAQADHERAESDHTRAESDHTTAGSDHTQAGTDHTRAESDHAQAASDHTQAGTDHTRAESDHATASADHTQAGTDHTRAESDHATASADHTQAGQDHTRAESDHTRAESDHAAVEVYVDSLGAFDISAYHATGGVLAKYADLTAALGTNGANIPDALRKGGMSVKFVLSSDNNYVQARCMAQNFTTDVTQWQGFSEKEDNNSDFSIGDEAGNDIVRFGGGHIKTKNFDSSTDAISQEERTKLASIETGAEVNNTDTENDGVSDFSISDELDNDILRVSNGYPQTKNFNGYNIKKNIDSLLSVEGNADILLLNPKSIYDGLITASKGSRIGTTKNVVSFCHFTDLHAAVDNLERMNRFNQRYADYIDDVVFSGDLVSNYGTEDIDYYTRLSPHALMCIGNHDSWVSGESADTEQIYQSGGNLYILKQTYVYNKYIKPYVSNWEVVQPSDAEAEGKCYYYKDYVISGNTMLRLIVLDVMHYGTVNDAIDSTHSKQDNWFVSVLEDARTNNIPVVVNCHYWGDFMDRLDCNYNEYDSTSVGVLCSGEISSIFHNLEGAARVQDFIDAGGEFICWITGHSHYDAIGTCRSYPDQLQVCLTGAGAGRSGTKAQRRIAGTKSYDAFNYISFDTNDKLIKVIRVGYDVDRYFHTKRLLVYRYKAFTDPITHVEHSVGLEVCK